MNARVEGVTRMPFGTITSKGRVTIPKPVRDALDLQPGDQIDFDVRDGAILGHVRRVQDVMELFHRLPGIDPADYDPEAESDAFRNAAIVEERKTRPE